MDSISISIKNKKDISFLRELARRDHSHTPEEVGADKAGAAAEVEIFLNEHEETSVASETGVHNFRYFDEKLEFYDGTDWVEIETGSNKIPPDQVGSIYTVKANQRVYIRWTDPNDIVIDGVTISKWKGTLVVRKEESMPQNIDDGITICDNQIQNKYSTTETYFTDTGLNNGTTYYYRFFTYSYDNVINNTVRYTAITPDHIVPANISIRSVTRHSKKVSFQFKEPSDRVIMGETLWKWAGTKILRKTNGYPANLNDGTVVLDNKIRNQYETTPFYDTGLTNNTQYFYAIFTYTTDGIVSTAERYSSTPQTFRLSRPFHVTIEQVPEIRVSWTDPPDYSAGDNSPPHAKWARTKIIRSTSTFPESEDEGDLILESTVRDKYQNNPFTDSTAVAGTPYYYTIIPYTEENEPGYPDYFYVEKKAYKILGLKVDPANPFTYRTDDSIYYRTNPSVGEEYCGYSEFDNEVIYRDLKLCNLVNGTVTAYLGDSNFSYTPDIGDVMLEIPKFYYKVDYTADEWNTEIKFSISNVKHSGYSTSPRHAGHTGHTADYDKIYVAAFPTNSDYRSTAENKDPIKVTRNTFRTNHKNKGKGYYTWDIATYWTTCLLYLIEQANFDPQLDIGHGVSGAGYMFGNGDSIKIAGHTGRADINTKIDSNVIKYRHLENLWGNFNQLLDGINFNAKQIYICVNPEQYADNTATNYTRLNYSLPHDQGYINNFGYDAKYPWALLPTSVTREFDWSTRNFIFDNYDTWAYPAIGGGNGSKHGAGPFAMDCYYGSSDEFSVARFIYLPQ